MARDFAQWLLTFTDSIANYKYYIDFETIYKNAEEHKIELNMMNSLIGSKTIENDFEKLVMAVVIRFIIGTSQVVRHDLHDNAGGIVKGCLAAGTRPHALRGGKELHQSQHQQHENAHGYQNFQQREKGFFGFTHHDWLHYSYLLNTSKT